MARELGLERKVGLPQLRVFLFWIKKTGYNNLDCQFLDCFISETLRFHFYHSNFICEKFKCALRGSVS